jgi:peptidylprolyl isomerase
VKRLRLVPFLLVPTVVLGLAACSGSGSDDPSSTPKASATTAACPPSGKESKSIKVDGDFGGTTAPTVTFDKGLSAKSVESTTTVKGSGKKLSDGDFIKVSYSVYQAKTAEKLGSVGFDSGSPQVLSVGGTGFGNALGCATVGSRLALIGASKTLGFGTTGQIVVIADVIDTLKTHSTGAEQTQDPALPTVKDKSTGEPQITIPDGYAAPGKTTTEVLKSGDGDTLTDADTVFVQYKGEVIKTGKVFDSTWSKGQPASFALSQVVPGFKDGLVGQKVGSQVLIVIPADQGYGANPQEGSGIPANADLLFVVDILAKG